MAGRGHNQLFEIAARRCGFVTTEDARRVGAARGVLVEMHRNGQLTRVGHGIYRFVEVPAGRHDDLVLATLWPRGLGVISHETALDLWGLCAVHPTRIDVTVPRLARVRRAVPPAYRAHVRDLDPRDVTEHRGVPVVTPLRAIRDGIARHLATDLIDQAIATARDRGHLAPEEVTTLDGVRP